GLVLDGEIYAHGKDFQTNTKLLKKYRPGESEALVLHAYDLIDLTHLDQPWSERHQNLLLFSENFTPGGPLAAVPTDSAGPPAAWARRTRSTRSRRPTSRPATRAPSCACSTRPTSSANAATAC